MGIQENKALATRFCDLITAGDHQGLLDLMTDDVNYWILGRREVLPSAGPHTEAQIKRLFQVMHEGMKDGMKFAAKSMIAEGDAVAFEAEGYAELKNGRVYNNQYHFRLTIRDGKIAEVREYLDTHHAWSVWFG